jgi:hypothetical protein
LFDGTNSKQTLQQNKYQGLSQQYTFEIQALNPLLNFIIRLAMIAVAKPIAEKFFFEQRKVRKDPKKL